VRLKWGDTEYKGRLVSMDLYMNIQLANTEEFVGGVSSGTLGQVLIRYVLGVEIGIANANGQAGATTFYGSGMQMKWNRKQREIRVCLVERTKTYYGTISWLEAHIGACVGNNQGLKPFQMPRRTCLAEPLRGRHEYNYGS
jgi:hypothetical protein